MKVFGVTGWKNSGKTTLVARLVEHFTALGMTVSTVKHAHCDFDIDREGSDSHSHRVAGAKQVMISSNSRWALMNELVNESELELNDLLQHMSPVDIVIVEGFKMGEQPKIQVVRSENNTDVLPAEASPIVAIASDSPLNPKDYNCEGPVFDLAEVASIADFILRYEH